MELKSRVVENPTKDHRCYACGSIIKGRHVYNVSVIDGDFYHGRFHIKCDARIAKMCGECEYSGDCQSTIEDCFFEHYIREQNHEQ